MKYEYKVIPAPKKPRRSARLGVALGKGGRDRFAETLASLMNELGAEGWEYQRTDTLPVEARSGLAGKTTVFENMLIFRRALEAEQGAGETPAPAPAATPEPAAPTPPLVADAATPEAPAKRPELAAQ